MGMVIVKYICEEIENKTYVRGKCCPDYKKVDYSNWIVIESNVDCGGVLIDEDNQPIWEVVDGEIINNPLPLNPEQIEERRRQWCSDEIYKLYDGGGEYRLINLGIKNKSNIEYIAYREVVEEILERSHDIGSN